MNSAHNDVGLFSVFITLFCSKMHFLFTICKNGEISVKRDPLECEFSCASFKTKQKNKLEQAKLTAIWKKPVVW